MVSNLFEIGFVLCMIFGTALALLLSLLKNKIEIRKGVS